MDKEKNNPPETDSNRTAKVKKRKFSGIVVSDAMDKTIVVRIGRVKSHPKYRKQYSVTKKFKVHDSQNKYHKGDKVEFVECRPISKEKRWKVIY